MRNPKAIEVALQGGGSHGAYTWGVLDRLLEDDRIVIATNVRTGKPRVFQREELTADMIMASACLPFVFQAAEIDGEAYWDGGYIGNPLLAPLVADRQSRDLLIVQINPIYRKEVPREAVDIYNRINEISFNAALIKELRALAYLKRLISAGNLKEERYKDVFFHRINADPELRPLGASSKLNGEWPFLKHLHDVGYRTTSAWLDENFEALGKRSTLDVEQVYF